MGYLVALGGGLGQHGPDRGRERLPGGAEILWIEGEANNTKCGNEPPNIEAHDALPNILFLNPMRRHPYLSTAGCSFNRLTKFEYPVTPAPRLHEARPVRSFLSQSAARIAANLLSTRSSAIETAPFQMHAKVVILWLAEDASMERKCRFGIRSGCTDDRAQDLPLAAKQT